MLFSITWESFIASRSESRSVQGLIQLSVTMPRGGLLWLAVSYFHLISPSFPVLFVFLGYLINKWWWTVREKGKRNMHKLRIDRIYSFIKCLWIVTSLTVHFWPMVDSTVSSQIQSPAFTQYCVEHQINIKHFRIFDSYIHSWICDLFRPRSRFAVRFEFIALSFAIQK